MCSDGAHDNDKWASYENCEYLNVASNDGSKSTEEDIQRTIKLVLSTKANLLESNVFGQELTSAGHAIQCNIGHITSWILVGIQWKVLVILQNICVLIENNLQL